MGETLVHNYAFLLSCYAISFIAVTVSARGNVTCELGRHIPHPIPEQTVNRT